MQLTNINKRNLIPLVVAGGMATSFIFKYDAIDHSKSDFVITNNETANFMQNADDKYYSDLSMKSIFNQKLELWKKNTMFLSFADQIVDDENFKEIVSMGERVVPFILEEISQEPSTLVWTLNFIYKKKISNNPNTTIEHACQLWLNKI